MSVKIKCHQNHSVTNTEMSPKLKIPKIEMLKELNCTKPKCHHNWKYSQTKILLNLKCPQNWKVTKTETHWKLKCHQKWNFTKTI